MFLNGPICPLLGGEMTKNLLLLTCATGALGLMAGVGHAATATASAAATDQGAASVTELVVTAEKRETSLQRVPVAVSVFTGAQRDAIGINRVADAPTSAPASPTTRRTCTPTSAASAASRSTSPTTSASPTTKTSSTSIRRTA